MRILFLDDDEVRHDRFRKMTIGHEVWHVRTVAEARKALAARVYDLVCLDHDLGGKQMVESRSEEGTGYHVAMAMEALPAEQRPADVVVHSYNPIGALRMANRLRSAGFRVTQAPFASFKVRPA